METVTWEDRLNGALCAYLKRIGCDAVKVTGFNDSAYDAGGCDTCGYDLDYEVSINYVDSNQRSRWHDYDGKFSDLIKEL